MGGKHKYNPLRLRLPAPLRERFDAYVERTGRAANAVLVEATQDYLSKHDPSTGTETTKEDQP